jgi:hypothetical protein
MSLLRSRERPQRGAETRESDKPEEFCDEAMPLLTARVATTKRSPAAAITPALLLRGGVLDAFVVVLVDKSVDDSSAFLSMES